MKGWRVIGGALVSPVLAEDFSLLLRRRRYPRWITRRGVRHSLH